MADCSLWLAAAIRQPMARQGERSANPYGEGYSEDVVSMRIIAWILHYEFVSPMQGGC